MTLFREHHDKQRDISRTPPNERVPTKPIAALINRWITEHKAESPSQYGNERTGRYVENVDKIGDERLSILSFHCGVSVRQLRRIITGKTYVGDHRHGTYEEVDWVSFDLADKIVCGTVGPLAWQVEPLKQHYGPLSVKAYERHLEEVAA